MVYSTTQINKSLLEMLEIKDHLTHGPGIHECFYKCI